MRPLPNCCMGVVLVNGRTSDHVPAADRGLAYGDGVFETIAIVEGKARHWDLHLARLRAGCDRLGIAAPDGSLLHDEVQPLLGDAGNAVLKIIVTRGQGGRGYRPVAGLEPTRIVSIHDWFEPPASWPLRGIDMWVCRTRLGRNPALAGIKHLNRLEQVLASREWPDESFAEGLMLDDTGLVVEGIRTNVFILSSGRARTPAMTHCGVAGIMRGVILEALPMLGVVVEECPVSLDAVLAADELFVCNSLVGIWPVKRISARQTKDYELGPLTSELQRYLRARGDIS